MTNSHTLKLKQLGINTYKETVIYMRKDCHVCRSEGFEAQARIHVKLNGRFIIATLNTIETDLLALDEASLSIYAWELLHAKENDHVTLSHPKPLNSLNAIRAKKIYGNELSDKEIDLIVSDVVSGYLSDIHISAFLSAGAGGRLSKHEILNLTQSMIKAGSCLKWEQKLIVDKHCVGGLPGNRTSMIIVPIVTAFGLTMPKTSSRAITSPAGTADTMEVLAPVNLDLVKMRNVVERENGCIVWGGSVALSPADDLFIRIEHALDIDTEGQLVASILSKKIAAGSSHIVIDIPIGTTAKVRTMATAQILKQLLEVTGKALGVEIEVVYTDGSEPVGRGIGPALEAKDVLQVLSGNRNAPLDLRDRSLILAGNILEFSSTVTKGDGKRLATAILDSGEAFKKFQAICEAQGGMFEPPCAAYTHVICAKNAGVVTMIDNRHLARIAKLAGAPQSKAAGVELFSPVGTKIQSGQPLYTIHAETQGELNYASNYIKQGHTIIAIKEQS